MFAKLVRSKVSNIVVSLSLVSVALLAGYAHEAVAATPTVRNETVTALVSGWGNGIIDPSRGGAENAQYSRLLHAMLVEGDGRGGLIGGVARSWDMSPDGRTWTFTIREGVKAHNGEATSAGPVSRLGKS